MSDTKHSAFPWRTGTGGSIVCDDESLGPGCDDSGALEYYGGHVVCETLTPANAEFIVRACNAHDDQLAALEAAVEYECSPESGAMTVASATRYIAMMERVADAIAKAKGETDA